MHDFSQWQLCDSDLSDNVRSRRSRNGRLGEVTNGCFAVFQFKLCGFRWPTAWRNLTGKFESIKTFRHFQKPPFIAGVIVLNRLAWGRNIRTMSLNCLSPALILCTIGMAMDSRLLLGTGVNKFKALACFIPMGFLDFQKITQRKFS